MEEACGNITFQYFNADTNVDAGRTTVAIDRPKSSKVDPKYRDRAHHSTAHMRNSPSRGHHHGTPSSRPTSFKQSLANPLASNDTR